MSGPTKTRQLLLGAFTLAASSTLAIAMASNAPLILYPITPSLPVGLYLRTFKAPKTGMIAVFRVPEAARRYKASIGEDVHHDFLFMKPIVAGPGDHVCNQPDTGLFLNGTYIASATTQHQNGQLLPLWHGCWQLAEGEFFTLSPHAPNSFDSRHYGPISLASVLDAYQILIALSEAIEDE